MKYIITFLGTTDNKYEGVYRIERISWFGLRRVVLNTIKSSTLDSAVKIIQNDIFNKIGAEYTFINNDDEVAYSMKMHNSDIIVEKYNGEQLYHSRVD